MKKEYKNKQIKEKEEKTKEIPFMFPANPPVTIWAKDLKEAEEKFNNLKK